MVRDPGLVMRGTGWTIARRLIGGSVPARYYCLEMRLQGRPRLVRTRLGLQIVYWMILTSPLLALIYYSRSRGARLELQIELPNPKLPPHGRFAPSLLVVDSYVGATSRPRLGPGDILAGLLSSGTPGRPIRRRRGVTPSSLLVRHMDPGVLI